MSDQITLRDMLESNLNAFESGTLGQVEDAAPIVESAPTEPQIESSRQRDEQGRFAQKDQESEDSVSAKVAETPPQEVQDPTQVEPQVNQEPAPKRPNTWKKEYLPMWDKLSTGQPLTADESRKLASYSQQREKEFASGVSTYRSEALAAKELQAAVAPFMPILQQNNTNVGEWIGRLGTAHKTLALGTPSEKLQMFADMAQQYGVPLSAVSQAQQGQVDPAVLSMMQQLQEMNSKVSSVVGWREQQEQNNIRSELARFEDTSKYPYFEQVKGSMAQLLESNMAEDLDSAYAKAVRLDDSAWEAEQGRQAQNSIAPVQKALKAEAVAKAKAAAVSPKSVTPSGTVKPVNAGGLRELLSAGFDSMSSARL